MQLSAPSRAKAFFDKIKEPGNGASFLKGLVGSIAPAYESEFLDFKHGRVADTDLLPLWGKSLSCFANSDGGVLIFGINAPYGEARSLSLANDVAALRKRLNDHIPYATEPPVQGVEIEAYEDPPGSNSGFVVCYIPSSPWRPHQDHTYGQPGQFYMRAADNCVPCGVATLRALFAPQNVAIMEVHYQLGTFKDYRNLDVCSFQSWLVNRGPSTAEDIFSRIEFEEFPMPPVRYAGKIWAPAGEPDEQNAITGHILHPTQKVSLFQTEFGNLGPGVSKTYKIGIWARNQEPTFHVIKFTQTDIKSGKSGIAELVLKQEAP